MRCPDIIICSHDYTNMMTHNSLFESIGKTPQLYDLNKPMRIQHGHTHNNTVTYLSKGRGSALKQREREQEE